MQNCQAGEKLFELMWKIHNQLMYKNSELKYIEIREPSLCSLNNACVCPLVNVRNWVGLLESFIRNMSIRPLMEVIALKMDIVCSRMLDAVQYLAC